MVLAVEQAELRRAAVSLYRAVHREALRHIAAVVLIRMDKEDRGLAVGRVLERRLLPMKFHLGSGVSALVV